MPIGIGILCSTERATQARPNAIVLLTALSSIPDPGYQDSLQRAFVLEDEKVFGVCIGQAEVAVDLISEIAAQFHQLPKRDHPAFARALNTAVHNYRTQLFHDNVLPDYRGLEEDIGHEQRAHILNLWQQFGIGSQMLVGTFDEHGRAVMYVVARFEGRPGWVHRTTAPGSASIGTTAQAANSWLHYRKQTYHCTLTRSAYHAYEAAHIALQNPEPSAIILGNSTKIFQLSDAVPKIAGCPVSIDELKVMFEKYGPRDTADLS